MFEEITAWHWLVIAMFVGIIDIVLVGTHLFLIMLGAAAVLVALCVALFPEISLSSQIIIFSILSTVGFIFWFIKYGKNRVAGNNPHLNRRSASYVGRVFYLENAIINGRGKVKVDDTIWVVSGPELPKGSQVKVVGVDGTLLIVKKFL